MLTYVRTTLVIHDQLFRDAKRKAASLGITLSQLVNDALRSALATRTTSTAGEYRVPTYGDPSKRVHHEPEDFAAMVEEDDIESLKR